MIKFKREKEKGKRAKRLPTGHNMPKSTGWGGPNQTVQLHQKLFQFGFFFHPSICDGIALNNINRVSYVSTLLFISLKTNIYFTRIQSAVECMFVNAYSSV